MPWDDKSKSDGPWGGKPNEGPKASGGGDGNSPWNRPSGGGNGGGKGGNDLEDQMRRMQERFRRGSGGGGKKGGGKKGGGFGPLGMIVVGGVALMAWLSTGVVMVDPGEQASVFRFGNWQTNFGPGFHLHLPAPFEEHVIVPVERQQQTSIGVNMDESLMLTEDENIVDLQFSVFWKVNSDKPQDFILNVKDPEGAVRQVSESVMREVIGQSRLQNVITTEREVVQKQVKEQVQGLLDFYRAGVEIRDVTIKKADPPLQVIEAFNDVNVAEQDALTNVNQATQIANQLVPEAQGTADRLLQEAEGYRDQVVADAEGEASRFEQIYAEYRKAPQVTRERMYLETMERVLERTDKTILDQNSGAVPYLQLDQVRRTGGN